ncbi:acyl-CoA Delta-9 desaturase-like [Cylas formicarius]|uniref:acyl-CoA Delta-9 desaturase-like n=1 Tax=Cylas formicarius TaxID=197179 RepID=UPI002958324F|nr:acyl-CoA Delta-9 desaturase-like [Cylas formicarius]
MAPNINVTMTKSLSSSHVVLKEATTNEAIVEKPGKYKCFLGEFETPLIWSNIIMLFILHVVSVWAIWQHEWGTHIAIVIYATIFGIIGGFGVTAGAHRLWTHRSYKATTPLRVLLLILYSTTGQNSLKDWVRDHRVHHKFSETDADPHNSKRGFFFAHVGWLCMKKHPEVTRKGMTVDISDIFEDPLVTFQSKHWAWFGTLWCFIIPTIIPPLWWGESWKNSILAVCFVRYVILLNNTWLVNSAAHLWGNRPYEKELQPVENNIISFLANGEGFHNYHHKFPYDYRASEFGKYNVTTFWIDIFKKLGLAYDLRTVPQDVVKQVVEAHGDGTHPLWGKKDN